PGRRRPAHELRLLGRRVVYEPESVRVLAVGERAAVDELRAAVPVDVAVRERLEGTVDVGAFPLLLPQDGVVDVEVIGTRVAVAGTPEDLRRPFAVDGAEGDVGVPVAGVRNRPELRPGEGVHGVEPAPLPVAVDDLRAAASVEVEEAQRADVQVHRYRAHQRPIGGAEHPDPVPSIARDDLDAPVPVDVARPDEAAEAP